MGSKFQVTFKKRNGDLHLQTRGDFDGSSAWRLINLLREKYDGTGRVFIDTRGLREICPFGCTTFQCELGQHRLPAGRLVFQGENGHQIAPSGSKVVADSGKPARGCRGNCAECRCAARTRRNGFNR